MVFRDPERGKRKGEWKIWKRKTERKRTETKLLHVKASDVVLEEDASPRRQKILMPRPHASCLDILLACLGLRKTASASLQPRPHFLGLALACAFLGSSR